MRVPTGAFVARRNGQVFVTGNSGFPKSLDVSKAIDKARRRDFVQAAVDMGVDLPGRSLDDWSKEGHAPGDRWWTAFKDSLPAELWCRIERRVIGTATTGNSGWFVAGEGDITAPATSEAAEWQGWGTALKPAWEPIVVARNPLQGTVAANVLAHGTGALNIDGCRVETGGRAVKVGVGPRAQTNTYGDGIPGNTTVPGTTDLGRWPANLAHDGSDEVLACFPAEIKSGTQTRPRGTGGIWSNVSNHPCGPQYGDSGSAARFFYCAKASRLERGEGNDHPTVKPVDLMRWLVRLVTPPGGTVLDPFAGSGSTGLAASIEQFNAILIEMNPAYAELARQRINGEAGLFAPVAAE